MRLHTPAVIITMLSLFAAPSFAQDATNREVIERMNKMERDMMTIQRQLARGGDAGGVAPLLENGDSASPADAPLVVRLSRMEDDMRALRGKTEENEFQLRKLNESLNKIQQDTEFRLNALEQAKAAPATKETPVEAPKNNDAKPSGADKKTDGASEPSEPTTDEGANKTPEKKTELTEPETPRDHYNSAFRLLNQTRYEDSAKAFKSFTEKHPKDPLIGNAYYWLGETYYIRQNYVDAADNFRAGFEVLPNGPKASDNLLKLSMSLAAMKKTKDACVVLDQLLVKFKDSSKSVAQKAQSERTRMGCK